MHTEYLVRTGEGFLWEVVDVGILMLPRHPLWQRDSSSQISRCNIAKHSLSHTSACTRHKSRIPNDINQW